ncbi:bifunctional diaminohydroxyphosphoribosylaminopyrimidine deaminase/5-amino-6-(5-phosphoribosylamino)uracil reductase RibD [Deinococcus humi]|uniref:Riboflavin biosynthesis protein RibD n=1 Tax=Deinococcus humi TaxID=662880 RepID=A0A7W8NIQ3_9DEIO|nr:bifunctional diaminohydroxyphosphoribosylaminopyrimidine deaminase/5-amino-6-(5-phosphoribosylamino)uracil reductase RibD [Deinococcus humi]MBB5366088.1 diaminohydroxyphosphoribosylaminopyrimidine deaminase/5-amino-6-(5-phosphoribosylamino)uracil reductase [Deinococcus humi]GGO40092.1 riboflavin biosynthesis protein RibD [Deinococcus humi]
MYTVNAPPDRVVAVLSADERWMTLALDLAPRGLGRTAPNPPVSCVIVQGDEVVGQGFHPRAGEPHAEVFAPHGAGAHARGATAYVTLEPCSHHGRTPPCTDALIASGVCRVVVSTLNPNPRVAGRGVQALRDAAIDVSVGILEAGATRQQAGFRSVIVRGRPWVVAKYAMTLDGKVAAVGEGNGKVSDAAARERAMVWRNELDAVAVGSGTLNMDDPALTTRGVPGGRYARAVVFDRQARSNPQAQAWRPGSVLVTAPDAAVSAFEASGITVVRAETPQSALTQLGHLGLSSMLLEGGPGLLSTLLDAGLVDEVRTFISPKLLGGGLSPLTSPDRRMNEAQELRDVTVETLGQDVLVTGLLSDIPRL